MKKAFFSQRLIAFIIDMLFITVVASLLSTPFIDTKKMESYQKEEKIILENYSNNKISVEEYFNSYASVYYKITRDSGILTLITILLEVIYFVVFQLCNGGQTYGKKIMKIKVVSDDGDLTMNQMIFRSLLSSFILVNLITFMFLLFTSKKVYLISSMSIQSIQYFLMFISMIMIVSNKDGSAIHDKLAHTKVVKIK